MKYTFIFLIGITTLIGCSNATVKEKEARITISGKVTNPQAGVITLQEIQRGKAMDIDTITLASDNTYSLGFNGVPNFYRMNFYGIQSVAVVLDNSNITVNVDGSQPRGFYEVTGSIEIDQIKKYNQAQASKFGAKEQDLNNQFGAAKKDGNEVVASAVQAEYMEMQEDKQNFTIETIKGIGVNLAVLKLIGTIDIHRHFSFVDSMALMLSNKYPTHYFIQQLISKLDKARKTTIGSQAPEISLPTPKGDVLTLSSLQGQVVLVDFWAQWCKPCRQENPNVVAAYKAYKDKGFTVYGVSLDRTKDKWMQAIQEDGLTWHHVSDLKHFSSVAAQDYGIRAIPFSILLDRHGKIVAKNLRGAALEATLEKLFAAEGK